MLNNGANPDFRPGSPSKALTRGNAWGSASAPALSSTEQLPCDDELLEAAYRQHPGILSPAADQHSRAGLHSSSSAHGMSRPGTGWSCSASSAGNRPMTSMSTFSASSFEAPGTPRKGTSGRFTSEELQCFKKVHHPSVSCNQKADVYFQTTGDVKRALCAENWHSLPALKGKFHTPSPLLLDGAGQTALNITRQPKRDNILPDEVLTAKVLNEIYPRTPRKREDLEIQRSPGSASSIDKMSPTPLLGTYGSSYEDSTLRTSPKGAKIRFMRGSSAFEEGAPSSPSPRPQPSPSGTAVLRKANSPTGSAATDGIKQGMGWGQGPALTPLLAMMDFRRLLIERYHSMDEALRLLCSEVPESGMMTKKDFRRSLQKFSLNLSKEERDAVFKHMDIDGDGSVSMIELDLAVQAASPVRNLGDLRRRWLAAGLPSLAHTIRIMDDAGASIGARLSLREFGEMLSHLYVMDPEEHLVLFNTLVDPSDRHTRVTMTELIAAVATQSPAMLMEELRNALHRKYAGHYERAFLDLDVERRGLVRMREFVSRASAKFGLKEIEARKLWREIDVDQSGRVTRMDFLSAIALSEPSLFLEDLRRKVLQRFRSIQDAFCRAFAEQNLRDDEKPPSLSLSKFQQILLPVELTEEETARLFALFDIDGNGSLTVAEFVKGTLQFAPSWAFEDLRLLCCAGQRQPYQTFADVELSRNAPLDFQAFSELLQSLGLAGGVKLSVIFDMLDVMHKGQATLGMLIAALQAGGPGSAVRLSEEDIHTWAQQDARGCIQGVTRLVGDLKEQVRQSPQDERDKMLEAAQESKDEVAPGSRIGKLRKNISSKMMSLLGGSKSPRTGNQTEGAGARTTSPGSAKGKNLNGTTSKASNAKKHLISGHRAPIKSEAPTSPKTAEDSRKVSKDKGPAAKLAPRLRTMPQQDIRFYLRSMPAAGSSWQSESSPQIPAASSQTALPNQRAAVEMKSPSQNITIDNQQSWGHVWKRLNNASGHKDRQQLEKDIQNYYQTATLSLSHDVPLLEKAHSIYALHSQTKKHISALQTEKQKAVYRLATQTESKEESSDP